MYYSKNKKMIFLITKYFIQERIEWEYINFFIWIIIFYYFSI